MRAVFAALALLVPGPVAAVTISEGTFGDFGNTLATRSVLPAQTTEIRGSVNFTLVFPGDPDPSDVDYAAFTDLVPGGSFTVFATTAYAPMGMSLRINDSTAALVVPQIYLPGNLFGGPQVQLASGIVPLSGELVFVPLSNDLSASYTFQLDAPRVVPEPGTALLLALGLVSLGCTRSRAVRRK